MPDQATELRKLVLRAAREATLEVGPPPRLLVLTGGKGGVGVTTIAVNLSIALADQGTRVVLVDADLHRADVATLCGLAEQRSVADVLTSRRDIHEVLVRGPAGIQIVPGLWAPGNVADYSEKSQLRLLRQLRLLGPHADIVVVDVGGGSNEVVRRFWQAADDVLLVTTPDAVAVMDAYATIKTLRAGGDIERMRLIVNSARNVGEAADVHRRLDQSCQRFLGCSLGLLGHVPPDEAVTLAARQAAPFVSAATGDAAQALMQFATILAAENSDSRKRHTRAAA